MLFLHSLCYISRLRNNAVACIIDCAFSYTYLCKINILCIILLEDSSPIFFKIVIDSRRIVFEYLLAKLKSACYHINPTNTRA